MGFDSKRSLEIEMQSAMETLDKYKEDFKSSRTVENEQLVKDQEKYIRDIAHEIKVWELHDELIANGYDFDADEEESVIEYSNMWSTDVTKVAEKMIAGNLRRLSFDDYVEEVVVADYESRVGAEGVEILRELQRWMSADDFKEFVKDHYTSGEEGVVENFDDDYILIMDM